MSIVTVYDRHGGPLTQIRTSITSMNWALNGIGEAEFPLATTDGKAQQRYLEFGTYITIEPGKLPMWGGIIDPDRTWDGAVITVKAYSGEQLLDLRGTDDQRTLKGSAGDIFRQLIALANEEENLLIRPGEIYSRGEDREENLGKHVLEHVQSIAQGAGNDWGLIPRRDENGILYFKANWYERRGKTMPFVLREGVEKANIERTPGRPLLVERGPMVNELTGLSDASTAGTRLRSVERVAASIGKYGLRTDSKVFNGVEQQAALSQSTLEAVKISAWPLRIFTITALDVGDLYDQLALGNVGGLELINVGFQASGFGLNTQVRILGMEMQQEGTGRVDLVLTEDLT